jgi:hypothetical protein
MLYFEAPAIPGAFLLDPFFIVKKILVPACPGQGIIPSDARRSIISLIKSETTS